MKTPRGGTHEASEDYQGPAETSAAVLASPVKEEGGSFKSPAGASDEASETPREFELSESSPGQLSWPSSLEDAVLAHFSAAFNEHAEPDAWLGAGYQESPACIARKLTPTHVDALYPKWSYISMLP